MHTTIAQAQEGKARSPYRLLLAVGGASACGVALSAAFPPLAWYFLLPVPLALLLFGLRRTRPPALRLGLAWAAGLGYYLCLLWWVHLFGWLPWVLLAAVQAVAFPLVVLLVAACAPAPGWPRALATAAAWAGVEWLRGQGTFGFAWGQLGISLAAAPALAQMAAWLGATGLSFLLVLLAALLAEWERDRTRAWGRELALLVALLVLVAGLSHWRYQSLAGAERAGADEAQGLTVAVVQGSTQVYLRPGEPERSSPAQVQQELALYEDLTRRALDSAPYLVVWPESALYGYVREDPALSERLQALAREGGCWLLAGGPAYQGPLFRNAAFLFGPDAYHGRYDKVHLVPFGEFVPGRGRLPLVDRYPVRPVDVTPGPGYVPLDAGGCKLGVLICFESIFPEIARAYARREADLLVVITNDAWFDRTAALRQHAQAAALRAIESGRYVVRAAYSGVSQVISPSGRVMGELGPGRRGLLIMDVYPASATAYAQVGYLFAPACLLVMLGWAAAASYRRLGRRRR